MWIFDELKVYKRKYVFLIEYSSKLASAIYDLKVLKTRLFHLKNL